MKRIIILIVIAGALLRPGKLAAQQGKLDSLFAKGDTTAVLDSLMRGFDAFVDSLSKPKSFFSINAGIGNRTFSIKNNSFNAQEATTNQLSVTPTLGYYHKSGLGISLTGFVTSIRNKYKFYQYALTPSYDYIGGKIVAGVSYTRYFGKDTAISTSSPYENDFYAYFSLRKGNWRYGLTGGYATGSFPDHVRYRDSALRYNPITQTLEWFRYIVSIHSQNKITAYSLSGQVRRTFNWYDVLAKDDNLTFSITGWIQAGSSTLNTENNLRFLSRKVNLSKFNRSFQSSGTEPFHFQSAALSCSIFYSIGKFNLQPIWYVNYYFPATQKNLSQVFSLMLGVNF
jgi:hypothetical protein